MHCNDTITCAITPGAGRVLPTTASVFKAVRKDEWDAGCNQRNIGCQRDNSCGCGSNCETSFGRNRNTNCGCNNGCLRESTCGCDNSCVNNCGTAFANCRNNSCECENNCSRNNGCQRESVCGCGNSCTNNCDTNCEISFGRNRNTECGCNNGCQRENTCNNDCSCNHRHGHHNLTPAMVYEQEHDLCQLHEIEEAIRKGTLFPQLYMPMKGECADACGAQLCEGQAEAFAAWELRLYLNTHPCDQQALKLFRKLARQTCQPNYATSFAEDCGEGWRWTDAPWPWEFNCGCE